MPAIHGRTQIRNAFVQALTSANISGINARVYSGRQRPLSQSDVDCLLVSTNTDDVSYSSTSPEREEQRNLAMQVRIERRVSSVDDAEALLDAIALAVEHVFASSTLGGLVQGIDLVRTEIGSPTEGEANFANATLHFDVWWGCRESTPETIA